jgi:hypothetical protein
LQGGNRLKSSLIGDPRMKEVRRLDSLLFTIDRQLRQTWSTKSPDDLKNIDNALKQTIQSALAQDFCRSIKLAERAYELSKSGIITLY